MQACLQKVSSLGCCGHRGLGESQKHCGALEVVIFLAEVPKDRYSQGTDGCNSMVKRRLLRFEASRFGLREVPRPVQVTEFDESHFQAEGLFAQNSSQGNKEQQPQLSRPKIWGVDWEVVAMMCQVPEGFSVKTVFSAKCSRFIIFVLAIEARRHSAWYQYFSQRYESPHRKVPKIPIDWDQR